MNKAKKVFYTVMTGVALGAAIGVLFAPDEGSETRKRLRKLKHKFMCTDGDEEDKALEEIRDTLQEELDKIDDRLAKK